MAARGQLREGRGLVGDDDALALVAEVDAEEELGAVVLEGGTRFGIERHFGREALLVHVYVHLCISPHVFKRCGFRRICKSIQRFLFELTSS